MCCVKCILIKICDTFRTIKYEKTIEFWLFIKPQHFLDVNRRRIWIWRHWNWRLKIFWVCCRHLELNEITCFGYTHAKITTCLHKLTINEVKKTNFLALTMYATCTHVFDDRLNIFYRWHETEDWHCPIKTIRQFCFSITM